jgi:hypothetical protein
MRSIDRYTCRDCTPLAAGGFSCWLARIDRRSTSSFSN